MSRSRFFATALLSGLLAWQPLASAETASKKSSSKKSSATAKKKTPARTTKKPAATPSATPPVDLPLPAELPGGATTGSAAEKKETEPASTASSSAAKATPDAAGKKERAPSATVEPEAIAEFAAQPARIQQLIRDAIDLTRLNLTYTFGSADPEKGGMDCSGTIYHLLRAHGFADVARDSSGQYLWARKRGAFFPVVSRNAESVEFDQLQPGDLMFWTGTYGTGRDVPISHVMMYLGREKGTKKRIMFGASDGRSYDGVQRWGVSVFDFKMPRTDATDPEKAKVDFVGFARIPGLREERTSDAPAGATDVPPKESEPVAPRGETTAKTAQEKKETLPAKSKTGTTVRKKKTN
jgi:cell wall-associated NlpC family hydrolase